MINNDPNTTKVLRGILGTNTWYEYRQLYLPVPGTNLILLTRDLSREKKPLSLPADHNQTMDIII